MNTFKSKLDTYSYTNKCYYLTARLRNLWGGEQVRNFLDQNRSLSSTSGKRTNHGSPRSRLRLTRLSPSLKKQANSYIQHQCRRPNVHSAKPLCMHRTVQYRLKRAAVHATWHHGIISSCPKVREHQNMFAHAHRTYIAHRAHVHDMIKCTNMTPQHLQHALS